MSRPPISTVSERFSGTNFHGSLGSTLVSKSIWMRWSVAPGAVNRTMRIDFDTNVSPKLPWKFAPEDRSDTVAIGARDMAFFTATNTSDHPITGTATFNVQPAEAGKYFTKIQCFCFTQQTLKPGETQRMPVIFYVDPAILKDPDARDIQTITLSYTFYPVDSGKTPS